MRKEVRRHIAYIDERDIPIGDLILLLKKHQEEAIGYKDITCTVGDDWGVWCIEIEGRRLESDSEYAERLSNEEDAIKRRREQYEALKEEFGP